ncbi:hypothetical protein FQN50_003942 [Emmonsiellopsis sp. PD_5]|nr:hypothetical protein FQN50_003942 [Emmonsiellopsis sp. PD_5]
MTSTTPTFKHPLIPARTISAVRLPHQPPNSLWDITFSPPDPSSSSPSPTSTITSITPHNPLTPPTNSQPNYPLALPPLTHPHIHLDKAFLHHHPSYTPHLPTTGTFPEALHLTSLAKAHFTPLDLLTRGRWVLTDSVRAGVTALRAFVEVDEIVGRMCLDVAVQLKREWRGRCAVQIVCFAQEAVFSGSHGGDGAGNRGLIERVLAENDNDGTDGIDVLGTTPYVESDDDEQQPQPSSSIPAWQKNINWAISTALTHNLHLDFHLDYTLDPSRPATVWYVLSALVRANWTRSTTGKKVMLGHCTRLTLFDEGQWRALAAYVGENDLPVYFVGLPRSDLYMAAEPQPQLGQEGHLQQPRGTLDVPRLIRDYGLPATLGVNNVGNAFTPWGSLDPLALASLGVGVYQVGTVADAELLYECVSVRAREAMGLVAGEGVEVGVGEPGEVLLIGYGEGDGEGGVGAMEGLEGEGYGSVAEVVWEPPAVGRRRVVCDGLWEGVGDGKGGEEVIGGVRG